jgi:hypothetical protein
MPHAPIPLSPSLDVALKETNILVLNKNDILVMILRPIPIPRLASHISTSILALPMEIKPCVSMAMLELLVAENVSWIL